MPPRPPAKKTSRARPAAHAKKPRPSAHEPKAGARAAQLSPRVPEARPRAAKASSRAPEKSPRAAKETPRAAKPSAHEVESQRARKGSPLPADRKPSSASSRAGRDEGRKAPAERPSTRQRRPAAAVTPVSQPRSDERELPLLAGEPEESSRRKSAGASTAGDDEELSGAESELDDDEEEEVSGAESELDDREEDDDGEVVPDVVDELEAELPVVGMAAETELPGAEAERSTADDRLEAVVDAELAGGGAELELVSAQEPRLEVPRASEEDIAERVPTEPALTLVTAPKVPEPAPAVAANPDEAEAGPVLEASADEVRPPPAAAAEPDRAEPPLQALGSSGDAERTATVAAGSDAAELAPQASRKRRKAAPRAESELPARMLDEELQGRVEPVTTAEASVAEPPATLDREPKPAVAEGPASGAVEPDRPEAREDVVSSLLERLGHAEARVEAGLQQAGRMAADAAARVGELASAARRELPSDPAAELAEVMVRLAPALRERLSSLLSLGQLFARSNSADAHGQDPELAERLRPLLDFLYETFWRVEVRGIENVPDDGPVLVIANHGGVGPWDALLLAQALARAHPRRRVLRPLLDEKALAMPIVGALASRLGAVASTPTHALELLGAGVALGIFPEGSQATTKAWTDRYRILQFGRGGFAKIALRAGAPIVPCAIVGSEEAAAPPSRPGWLSAQLGVPLPAAAPSLPLGGLGLVPLPSRWSLRFGPPIDLGSEQPGTVDDPARALAITETTRATLQRMLDEDVAARRSVYL